MFPYIRVQSRCGRPTPALTPSQARARAAQAVQASGPFKNPPSSQGYHAQVTWSAGGQWGPRASQWWWSSGELSFTDTMFWVSFNPGLTEGAALYAWQSSWQVAAVSWHWHCRSWQDTAVLWCARQWGYTHTDFCLQSLQRKAALVVRVLTSLILSSRTWI